LTKCVLHAPQSAVAANRRRDLMGVTMKHHEDCRQFPFLYCR
jgi:hypothetical protein